MFSFYFAAVVFFTVSIQCNLCELCHEEGATWKTPSTVLTCTNGTWLATGCLTDTGKLIADGDVIRTESYLIQCQKVDMETMQMVTIGCLKNGRLLAPTQTLTVGDVYFQCKPVNRTLDLQLAGCFSTDKQLVPIDEHLQVDTVAFKCTLKDSSAFLEPHGCVLNNKTYMVGQTANDDLFWYVCQKINNQLQLVKSGCMDGTLPLKTDSIFYNSGFMYKCVYDGEIKRKPFGCLEVTQSRNIIEHSIGEKWLEGSDNKVKYYIQCSEDDNGLHKTPVQCYFINHGQGTPVEPGCLKKVGQFLYQCAKSGNGELKSVTIENPNPEVAKVALMAGFKFCN